MDTVEASPRPFVYMNMASTIDGKITSATREYPRFSAPTDRLRMDRLRAEADAILVGAGTLRADQPTLHVRDPEMQRYRRSLGKNGGLTKIAVSRTGDIPPDNRFFKDSDGGARIVATVAGAPAERLAWLKEHADVWLLGEHDVDFVALLERLRRNGIERLLVEGGGEVNWKLIEANLVDELYVTLAPALLGGREAPTLLEGRGFTMKQQVRLRLIDLERSGDELYCRYALIRESP